MKKHFWHRGSKMKQSQRLMMISNEARKIRMLHEAGKISAQEASRRLDELRAHPEEVLQQSKKLSKASAA